jgi:hypothetical protein
MSDNYAGTVRCGVLREDCSCHNATEVGLDAVVRDLNSVPLTSRIACLVVQFSSAQLLAEPPLLTNSANSCGSSLPKMARAAVSTLYSTLTNSAASNAGRLAWMSEISAYCISLLLRFLLSAAPHDDGRIRARAAKFRGFFDRLRNRCAGSAREAESRKIFFGRSGK